MHRQRWILVVAVVLSIGYAWLRGAFVSVAPVEAANQAAPAARGQQKATFAAGCFWCVEADFDKVKGVISTTSGYTGGRVRNPTYEQVSAGAQGTTEAAGSASDPPAVPSDRCLNH